MKKWIFASLAIMSLAHAKHQPEPARPTQTPPCCPTEKNCAFYIKVGSGACFSGKTKIKTDPAVWDTASQGYNGHLGTQPIVLAGLGFDSPFVATDLTASLRPNFQYSKYQTPTTLTTPEELGNTTRKFTLDIATLMQTIYLSGRGFGNMQWKFGGCSSIYPVIGGGVGISQMKIYNFRSTGLAPIDAGFASFASENQYSTQYKFTYQALGGLEYRYKDLCAFSLGYRWFDVFQFKGPRYLRDAEGNAADVGSAGWKIDFSANELFGEFKVFL